MSTAPRTIPNKKRKPTAESTAKAISKMVEETFSKMTPEERETKHKQFIHALKGARNR